MPDFWSSTSVCLRASPERAPPTSLSMSVGPSSIGSAPGDSVHASTSSSSAGEGMKYILTVEPPTSTMLTGQGSASSATTDTLTLRPFRPLKSIHRPAANAATSITVNRTAIIVRIITLAF